MNMYYRFIARVVVMNWRFLLFIIKFADKRKGDYMKAKFNLGDVLVEISNGCKTQFDSELLSRKTVGFYFEYGDFPEVITGDEGYRYYAVFNLLWLKFFISWVHGSFELETDIEAEQSAINKAIGTDLLNTAATYKSYPTAPLFPVE